MRLCASSSPWDTRIKKLGLGYGWAIIALPVGMCAAAYHALIDQLKLSHL